MRRYGIFTKLGKPDDGEVYSNRTEPERIYVIPDFVMWVESGEYGGVDLHMVDGSVVRVANELNAVLVWLSPDAEGK